MIWVVEEILASATDTVISASPAPTAVTRPVSSTVATSSSEEDQVRFSLDAASAIFSCSALSSVPYSILSCWVSPFSSTMSVGSPTEVISMPQPTRLTAIATAIIRHAIRVNVPGDLWIFENFIGFFSFRRRSIEDRRLFIFSALWSALWGQGIPQAASLSPIAQGSREHPLFKLYHPERCSSIHGL